MRFYTNKTKPKCNRRITVLTDIPSIEHLTLVRECKKELACNEFYWSEWKDTVVVWQYEDEFNKLIRKRICPSAWMKGE